MRARVFMLKVINANHSVSSWLWVIASLLTSIILLFLILDPNTPGVNEFLDALPIINPIAWLVGLMLGSVITGYGMLRSRDRAIANGSFISFILWVFGLIAFSLIGQASTVAIIIVPYLIFYSYMFLASIFRTKLNM